MEGFTPEYEAPEVGSGNAEAEWACYGYAGCCVDVL